jgi:hypothetical protein
MKAAFALALALLVSPTFVSAQVEVGLDAGFMLRSIDDADDNLTAVAVPSTTGFVPMVSGARIGFPAGQTVVVESIVNFGYQSSGDESVTIFGLIPGVNVLLGERLYVRGEAGLSYISFGEDDSETQYLLGGGLGLRNMLGEGALLRLEAGVDRVFENEDDFAPGSWDFRALIGLSAIIGP